MILVWEGRIRGPPLPVHPLSRRVDVFFCTSASPHQPLLHAPLAFRDRQDRRRRLHRCGKEGAHGTLAVQSTPRVPNKANPGKRDGARNLSRTSFHERLQCQPTLHPSSSVIHPANQEGGREGEGGKRSTSERVSERSTDSTGCIHLCTFTSPYIYTYIPSICQPDGRTDGRTGGWTRFLLHACRHGRLAASA